MSFVPLEKRLRFGQHQLLRRALPVSDVGYRDIHSIDSLAGAKQAWVQSSLREIFAGACNPDNREAESRGLTSPPLPF